MNFCPSKGRATKSEKASISDNRGKTAFKDCFIAEIRILFRRSSFNSFRSENRHFNKAIESMPISVTFSANHSILSRFFVGAIATCTCARHGLGTFDFFNIRMPQRFGCARTISARYLFPPPSTIPISSPSPIRKTLTQCWLSASGSSCTLSISGA